MTNCDDLVKQNEVLRAENAELKRLLELKEDLAREALGGSGTVALQYLRQRDEAQARQKFLEDVIGSLLHLAQYAANEKEERLREYKQAIDDSFKTHGLSDTVAIFISCLGEAERLSLERAHNAGLITAIEKNNNILNFRQDPGLAINAISWCYTLVGIREMTAKCLAWAFLRSYAPSLVCDQIIRECKTNGRPRSTTLSWLKQPWIDEHLKKGLSLTKLSTALKWAQQCLDEQHRDHISVEDFVKLHENDGPSIRTMWTYLSWRNVIEETGKQDAELKRQSAEIWGNEEIENAG